MPYRFPDLLLVSTNNYQNRLNKNASAVEAEHETEINPHRRQATRSRGQKSGSLPDTLAQKVSLQHLLRTESLPGLVCQGVRKCISEINQDYILAWTFWHTTHIVNVFCARVVQCQTPLHRKCALTCTVKGFVLGFGSPTGTHANFIRQ